MSKELDVADRQTVELISDDLGLDHKVIPDVPIIPAIDAAIEDAINNNGILAMETWHGEEWNWCGTTHCRGGWAIHLAGEKGKALQDSVGVYYAAALVYCVSRPGAYPDFYTDDGEAWDDIQKCAARQRKALDESL